MVPRPGVAEKASVTGDGEGLDGKEDRRRSGLALRSRKTKSLLRKACISLFKTWIPDHPEASIARGEVSAQYRDALSEFSEQVTFVSLLSFGSEDMYCHDFLQTPLSMQELLVQREGTDAFLDPKTALRVVRRKFGMMTLIARMASTLEQRNIISIRVTAKADEAELLNFAKVMNVRVEGTASEEEIEFRRRARPTSSKTSMFSTTRNSSVGVYQSPGPSRNSTATLAVKLKLRRTSVRKPSLITPTVKRAD